MAETITRPWDTSPDVPARRKRRCSRSTKNMEDVENQRMAHIVVERKRRKQMNEYLSVIRALLPESHVQKVDQASIVGGAINYVKELEQKLQFLSGQNHLNQDFEARATSPPPFADFFSFPQYSTTSSAGENLLQSVPMGDIEVTRVENHANIKIRSEKRRKQLPEMVNGLQSLGLTVLHLNVTTADQIILYSVSVKMEDYCHLNSVDDIAAAVNQMLARIQLEGSLIYT